MLSYSVTTVSGPVIPFMGPLLSAAFYICKIKPSRMHYAYETIVPALIYAHKILRALAPPRNQSLL